MVACSVVLLIVLIFNFFYFTKPSGLTVQKVKHILQPKLRNILGKDA